MTDIIRDPEKLNPFTKALWEKQEGLIKIYNLPFRTFETLRTHDRQLELLQSDPPVTTVEHSRHEDGDAWDVAEWANGDWTWKDVFWFQVLGIITSNLISGVTWGGSWKNFHDWGHYERS
jgi:hypothetical protein